MKKFLITGGVLFSILPAMALQLTDVIEPNDNGDCSGENFQSNSVSMQAVYVTETCPAGYYFDVPANAAIDSTTGIVTGASCQPCTDGYYCPSTVTVAANNGALNTQGRTQCPAGTYGNATDRGTIPSDTNDPDYNTILANYTACQACSGTTYASNTGSTSCTSVTQGWYAAKTNPSDPGNTTQTQCPFGYRTIAAASQGDCTKTISCSSVCSNFNNVITAADNPADPTTICSASVNSNNNNIVNGNVTFNSQNADSLCLATFECKSGYDLDNIYTWLKNHLDRIPSNYSYCAPSGITNSFESGKDNPGYAKSDCSNNEPGTMTWRLTGAPMDEMHFVVKCSTTQVDTSTLADLANTAVQTSISGTPGVYCWARNIDLPDQPWFIHNIFESVADCTAECGTIYHSGDEINPAYLFDEEAWDMYRTLFQNLAQATDGQNGHPAADVCVANTVTINWGDIADPGDAGTCTYGEDFTAPSGPNPADHPGLKFLGWKVVQTNNNNNN